eukprot:jgi/Chlat1/2361/Chrsp17S02808
MHRTGGGSGGSISGFAAGQNSGGSGGSSWDARSDGSGTWRRSSQLTPYRLLCDRDSLSDRLGPADFYPVLSNCPEDTLTRETVQSGYKDHVDGFDEHSEITLTFAMHTPERLDSMRQTLRQRLRILKKAVANRRKAGQQYGIPFAASQLAIRPYVPEQKTYSEELKRKWMEDLAGRKRLRALADSVPHGYRRRTLFEAVTKQSVPLLRASWYIKVVQLNQFRPTGLGGDKAMLDRSGNWTLQLEEYLEALLDELTKCWRTTTPSQANSKPPLTPSSPIFADLTTQRELVSSKWKYVMQLATWLYAESLLDRTHVVDWLLRQLQDREQPEATEALSPLLLTAVSDISRSQRHLRLIMGICAERLKTLDRFNPAHSKLLATLTDIIKFFLGSGPDSFVALESYPVAEEVASIQDVTRAAAAQVQNNCASSVQQRAAQLAAAVLPVALRNNVIKKLEALNTALSTGSISKAYEAVFDGTVDASLQLAKTANADSAAVVLLCTWAVSSVHDNNSSQLLTGVLDETPTARVEPPRVHFCTAILRHWSAKVLKEKQAADRSQTAEAQQQVPPVHKAVMLWLSGLSTSACHDLRVNALLTELIRDGLFFPDLFVREVIAKGLLEKQAEQDHVHRSFRLYLQHMSAAQAYLPQIWTKHTSQLSHAFEVERRTALYGAGATRSKRHRLRPAGSKTTLNGAMVRMVSIEAEALSGPSACGVLAEPGPAGMSRDGNGAHAPGESLKLQMRSRKELLPALQAALASTLGLDVASAASNSLASVVVAGQDVNGPALVNGKTTTQSTSWPVAGKKRGREESAHALFGGAVPKRDRSVRSRGDTIVENGSPGTPSGLDKEAPHYENGTADMPLKNGAVLPRPHRPNDTDRLAAELSKLRPRDRAVLSSWLSSAVKSYMAEELQKTPLKAGSLQNAVSSPANKGRRAAMRQRSRSFSASADAMFQRCLTVRQVLNIVLYFHCLGDCQSMVQLLLWLLAFPGHATGSAASTRSDMEFVVLSLLRQSEDLLVSMQMLPDALTAALDRVAQCLPTSAGRVTARLVLSYARDLLQQYGLLESIADWKLKAQAKYDRRTLAELEATSNTDDRLGYSSVIELDPDLLAQASAGSGNEKLRFNMRETVLRFLGAVQLPTHVTDEVISSPKVQDAISAAANALAEQCRHGVGRSGEGGETKVAVFSAATVLVENGIRAAVNAIRSNTANGISLAASCDCAVAPYLTCLIRLNEALGPSHSSALELAFVSAAANSCLAAIHRNRGNPERPEAVWHPMAAAAMVVGAVSRGFTRLATVIEGTIRGAQLQQVIQGILTSTTNLELQARCEAYVFWARTLLGGGPTITDSTHGLLLVTASQKLALARAQRHLSAALVVPPVYVFFAVGLTAGSGSLLEMVRITVQELIGHVPFRDACLYDTRQLFKLLLSCTADVDTGMSQSMTPTLDAHGVGPRRPRLFLQALVNGQMPFDVHEVPEDQNREILAVLDTLQPTSFHWQWLQLRLLLNEQVYQEKLSSGSSAQAAFDAAAAAAQATDAATLCESEKNFTSAVLTRLLVRPWAATLYGEVIHALSKGIEEYLTIQARWLIDGDNCLYGRTSLRQQLENLAKKSNFELPMEANSTSLPPTGAVVVDKPFVVEKALAELVLPCLQRASHDTQSGFASKLVSQMGRLAEYVIHLQSPRAPAPRNGSALRSSSEGSSYGGGRWGGGLASVESRGAGGGSLGPERVGDLGLSASIHTSLWTRLQFLFPLLPMVFADREANHDRNMRSLLAPAILRMLGSKVVQDIPVPTDLKEDVAAAALAAATEAGETLWDRLLAVLHALLSPCWVSWLKPKTNQRVALKEVGPYERASLLQGELNRMQLPKHLWTRIQAALPCLPARSMFVRSAAAICSSEASFVEESANSNADASETDRRLEESLKLSAASLLTELDPWTLLEDSSLPPGGLDGSAPARVSAWLEGAVRIRRTNLTYASCTDEES